MSPKGEYMDALVQAGRNCWLSGEKITQATDDGRVFGEIGPDPSDKQNGIFYERFRFSHFLNIHNRDASAPMISLKDSQVEALTLQDFLMTTARLSQPIKATIVQAVDLCQQRLKVDEKALMDIEGVTKPADFFTRPVQ